MADTHLNRLRAERVAVPRPRTGGREGGRGASARAESTEPVTVPVSISPAPGSGEVPPLGAVGSVVCAVIGLLVAVVAVLVATHMFAASAAFRTQAQLRVVFPVNGGDARLARLVASGQPTKSAGTVIADRDVAARATAGVTGSPAISVAATPDLITITVTASSASVAEHVAQKAVDLGVQAASPVIRPLRLVEVGDPAGSAVAAGWSAGVVTAVIAPPAFLLGFLIALVTRWLIRRRREYPAMNEP